MTYEDATVRLGLSGPGPFPPDEVRRAYLKAVKRHKPEVDPEGFQRVRAAFELLRETRSPYATFPVWTPPVAAATPPVAPATPPVAPATPPVEDPLQPFYDRLDDLDGEVERLALAREAVARLPDNPGARALLLDELPREARGEIIAVALEGLAAGDHSCRRRLLEVAPEALPDRDVDHVLRDGTTLERFQTAEGLVLRRDYQRAMNAFDQALAGAETEPPDVSVLHHGARVVLRFHRHAERVWASRALAALQRWQREHPSADRLSPAWAVPLIVAADIEACPLLPVELQQELALSGLEGDFSGVLAARIVADRVQGFWARRRWNREVVRNAPTIAALLGDRRIIWFPHGKPASLAALLMLGLLFGSGFAVYDLARRGPAVPKERPTQALVPLQERREFQQLWSEFHNRCVGEPSTPYCHAGAVAFRRATSQPYCKPLLDAVGRLETEARRMGLTDQNFAYRLSQYLSTGCVP